jgi:hypothetical protein
MPLHCVGWFLPTYTWTRGPNTLKKKFCSSVCVNLMKTNNYKQTSTTSDMHANFSPISFLKEKYRLIRSPSCLSPYQFINAWTDLMKSTIHVVSLIDIRMEPIQFLNFKNYIWNKFLKFDFKAIWFSYKDSNLWVLQLILVNLKAKAVPLCATEALGWRGRIAPTLCRPWH